jgi:peptidase, M23 family
VPKQKYQFNLESLAFTRVKRGAKHYFILLLRYFLASVALAILSYIVYSFFSDTPREKQLANDNIQLEEYLNKLNERYQQVTAVLEDIRQRDDHIYRTIFEAEPAHNDEQEAERVVTNLYKELQDKGSASIVDRTSNLLNDVMSDVTSVTGTFDTLINLAQDSTNLLRSIPALLPIARSSSTRVAAPFAICIHPFYKVLKMHNGVDFAASIGTPVRATADGVVKSIVSSKRGHGNTVILEHGNGYETVYAHLDAIRVLTGQKILSGAIIGTVGNTGMSVAPHLHYEVHLRGEAVDPLHYFFLDLTPLTLAELAQSALQSGQSLD